MTVRLSLICHASTAATRSAAFPGDEPIDDVGRKRLAELSVANSGTGRCWTSPALRARQTAEALHLDAAVEPLLRDCDYGRWTGRIFEDLQSQEPEALSLWLADPEARPHGGESFAALIGRVGHWLDLQADAPGRVLAITHAPVIRAAIVHALGAPPRAFWRIDVAPLSLTRLNGTAKRWTLSSLLPLAKDSARDET